MSSTEQEGQLENRANPWESTSQTEEPQARMVRVRIPLAKPLWTYVILAINIMVFLAMTAMGGSEQASVLVSFGAKFTPAILAGQYWRLLTSCFVHIGIVHLLFNSYALYSFGDEVERRYGRSRFLALYLLAGVAGSAVSFVGRFGLGAGASGAIFGLVGAMIAYLSTYRDRFGAWGKRQLTNVLLVAGYNLVFGFVAPGIDNFAHIGGLLAGMLIGWAYCPHYDMTIASASGGDPILKDRFSRSRAWAVSGGVVLLLVLLVYVGALRWS